MMEFGIDIETHDPLLKDHGNVKARGVSWVFDEGEVLVTGVYDADASTKKSYDRNGGAYVKKLLTNPKATLVGARIIYDLGWLCHEHKLKAKDVKCTVVDVALVESVIDEYAKYSLDELAYRHIRERKGSEALATIAAKHGLKGDFRGHLKVLWYGDPETGIPQYRDEIRAYVISDADQPVRIWQEQKKILTARGLWAPVIRKNKLIKVMLSMKQRGVKIDTRKKAENYVILKGHQDRLYADFESRYGKVNFNSPKQLAALFDRQGVPYRHKIRIKSRQGGRTFEGGELWEERKRLKNFINGVRVQKGQIVLYIAKQYAARTAADLESAGYVVTNNPSIDKKALDAVKNSYPIAKEVVDLKQVTSIIDKFMGPSFDRFITKDGRIHADFNISGARQTGRMSSSSPNLQQVPSKTVLFRKTDHEINLAKMCREVLLPDDDMLMGKMDYSGQENVLMAHFAVGDGAAEIRAKYRSDPEFDFHAYMGQASGLYEEYGEDVGRKYAKNCSFGLGYGMQITTMMETFGWSKEQAESIMDAYNDAAPFVRATMDKVSKVIVDRGFIKTLGGKQLHLRKYNGKPDVRSAYKGFNKLIQGSAADMMEEALVKIYDADLDLTFPLYLVVHDEIDFGVPNTKEAIARLPELKAIMENALTDDSGQPLLSVPIRVDPELGPNWGNMYSRFNKITEYKKGAKCFELHKGLPVAFRRISETPEKITDVPTTHREHWKSISILRRAA
jgi:DNA polymerase I-like protein with 3'-5' exonuclease and polymerase domains